MKTVRSFKTLLKAFAAGEDDMFGYPAQPYVFLILFLAVIFVVGTLAALVAWLI